MGRPGETEELMWFAMRVTYHRELEAKRLLDEKGVENFIPMKYEKSPRTGKKRLVPVIHNIIFVRATASGIQELKQPTRIPSAAIHDRSKTRQEDHCPREADEDIHRGGGIL